MTIKEAKSIWRKAPFEDKFIENLTSLSDEVWAELIHAAEENRKLLRTYCNECFALGIPEDEFLPEWMLEYLKNEEENKTPKPLISVVITLIGEPLSDHYYSYLALKNLKIYIR